MKSTYFQPLCHFVNSHFSPKLEHRILGEAVSIINNSVILDNCIKIFQKSPTNIPNVERSNSVTGISEGKA